MKNKRFYIENLGCAKNQVDAESMISTLVANGWEFLTSAEDADVIIINTCGFIESAKEQSIEVSLDFKNMYPGKRVIMAGCLSERYGAELKEQLTEIDGFLGNKTPEKILSLAVPESNADNSVQAPIRKQLLSPPGSAYVKIAEGCNNRCTYCSIPLIRGPLASRDISEITAEIAVLQQQGIVEFNLVAQELGSFGRYFPGNETIGKLFAAIAALDGHFWIRPLYIHPDKFPYEILDLIKHDRRFLPYFDLPFQHASGRILQKMGRRGNREQYLQLIDVVRSEIPDAVIRSTLLVGFPGEEEADFEELLNFQKAATIDWLGIFTYSKEEGTAAWSLPGKVSKKQATQRKHLIEQAQVPITEERLERFVGRELDILVEERVERERFYLGRCYAQAPEVDGLIVLHGENLIPGRLVKGRIIRCNGIDLEAVLL